MKNQIKAIISLTVICLITALLLACTNYLTAPIIEKAQNAAANEALLQVLPNGEDFEKIDISSYELPATVVEAYSEKNGGRVFKLVTAGYSPDLTIMCGINADGSVSGAVCLSSGETLGYEKTYGDSLKGATDATINSIDIISGATKTTGAYRAAVLDAINAFKIIGGESVDIRTPEEILADNLNTALPAGNGAFTPLFIVEEINGVDAVYTADNGQGAVYVCGESFIGVDANGKVVSEADAELKATVEAAAVILAASSTTEIDLTAFEGLPTAIVAASKTASGNYVLTVKGAGYGINGGSQWHPASGEYIIIKISMTAEGKIINCLTVSEEETDGIGDACAKPDFYSQFNGKTESNYEDIDAIGGATITTNGYKKAVLNAFKAVTILNGGAENE